MSHSGHFIGKMVLTSIYFFRVDRNSISSTVLQQLDQISRELQASQQMNQSLIKQLSQKRLQDHVASEKFVDDLTSSSLSKLNLEKQLKLESDKLTQRVLLEQRKYEV